MSPSCDPHPSPLSQNARALLQWIADHKPFASANAGKPSTFQRQVRNDACAAVGWHPHKGTVTTTHGKAATWWKSRSLDEAYACRDTRRACLPDWPGARGLSEAWQKARLLVRCSACNFRNRDGASMKGTGGSGTLTVRCIRPACRHALGDLDLREYLHGLLAN